MDALLQLVRWGSEHKAMPKPGRRPVQVMATVTLRELYGMAGLAYLNNGDPLSVEQLLAKAGETDVSLTIHQQHWRAVMLNGIPHTIPPPWIDPDQQPRRNRVHDPPSW